VCHHKVSYSLSDCFSLALVGNWLAAVSCMTVSVPVMFHIVMKA
jgi:hypothetical protein